MEEKRIKKILDEYKEETKRHFDVVAEKIEGKIALLAEQVAVNTEKLTEHDSRFDKIEGKLTEYGLRFNKIEGKLKDHDLKFDKIEETLQIIKLDIEFIKNELKQKVSREEFAALEKRVSLLEAKFNKLK